MFSLLKILPEGKNWTLDELNEIQVQILIPAIVFISICIVVGTVGNALVLYVNIFVIKLRNSPHRHFITFLGLSDITICMIFDTFLLMVLTHPYTLRNKLICKYFRAFNFVSNYISALTLVAIALDRYRRICRAHENQFSVRNIKCIFAIVIFFSFIISIPSFILYGKTTIKTGFPNITGSNCFIDDKFVLSWFPHVHIIFLYVTFIITAALISVFYILVWRKLIQHNQPMEIGADVSEAKVLSCAKDTNDIVMASAKIIADTHQNIDTVIDNAGIPGKCINTAKNIYTCKTNTLKEKTIRVSMLFFVVTAFYVFSNVPFYTLTAIAFLKENFVYDLDNTSAMFFELFWRSYAINSMVNPLIYGIMDTRFRMACRKLVLEKLRILTHFNE
ncbi:hypothetical protein CHS0354_014253 [Potamilus streckersoni]|uniref:G-protein coupled receptors family 1 profile domain-containing protein n=1 Tax=Potamilus streckersoni TaxID=2493646 RepID=A0AAE0T2P6_9BIVA|nr:hypothetical protein CHS0354_014253 [Potamilus streckersoni]